MSNTETPGPESREIDVRALIPSQRHPMVFDAYGQLAVGESLTVINDH